MNASAPLLRDIHLPPATWWPPALGWWLLAGLVVLAAAVIAWFTWRRTRRHALRAAMREIDALDAAYARNEDSVQLVDGASRLLRRVARVIDPAAASRSANAWRSFLLVYARGADTKETLDHLVEARFQERPVMDAPALLAALRAWCGNALRRNGPRATGRGGAEVSRIPFPFIPKNVDAPARRDDEGTAS